MAVKKYLTVSEVAKILRVSQRSVMRYIKAKRLLAAKIGQWRIKKSDLNRFVAASSNR
jgi:excisionase family DNA binding protein